MRTRCTSVERMADYTLLRNLPGMRRGKGFVWDLRDTREVNCDRFSDNWLTANCRTNQKLASRGKGTLRNGPEVLVLYRKREEARRAHEHGVFARFRYNDLKEAGPVAGAAGTMQIQWQERAV